MACKAGSRNNYNEWNQAIQQQYEQPPPPQPSESFGFGQHQAAPSVYDPSSLPMLPESLDDNGLSAFPTLNLGYDSGLHTMHQGGNQFMYEPQQPTGQQFQEYQLPPSNFVYPPYPMAGSYGQSPAFLPQNIAMPEQTSMMGHGISSFHTTLPSIRTTTTDHSSSRRSGGESGSMTSRVGGSRSSRGKNVAVEEDEDAHLPYQAQTARVGTGYGQEGVMMQGLYDIALEDEQLGEGEEELLRDNAAFFQQLWDWRAIDTSVMPPLEVAERAAEIRWSFKDDVDTARLFGAWSGRKIKRETRIVNPAFHKQYKVQNERFRRKCSELRRRMALQPRKYPDEEANDAEGLALIRKIAAEKEYAPRYNRDKTDEEKYDERAEEVWQEFCETRGDRFPGRDMYSLTASEIERASRSFKYRGCSKHQLGNFFRYYMQTHLGMDAEAIQVFDENRAQAEIDHLQTMKYEREKRLRKQVERRVGRE